MLCLLKGSVSFCIKVGKGDRHTGSFAQKRASLSCHSNWKQRKKDQAIMYVPYWWWIGKSYKPQYSCNYFSKGLQLQLDPVCNAWILVQSYLQLELVLAVYIKKRFQKLRLGVHAVAVWPLGQKPFLSCGKGVREENSIMAWASCEIDLAFDPFLLFLQCFAAQWRERDRHGKPDCSS